MADRTTSNSWRVWVEKEGDAYICCRDNMKEIKVSLHKSGHQRIAYREESGKITASGSRVWLQWKEPPAWGPVLPSFKLVLPPWGVRLDLSDRTRSSRVKRLWEDNQLLIRSDERHAVIVDFIVRDGAFLPDDVGHAVRTLAIIPAPTNNRPNRHLSVVLREADDGHFHRLAQRALDNMSGQLNEESALLIQEAETPVACISGYGDKEHSHAYLVVAPVCVQPSERKQAL